MKKTRELIILSLTVVCIIAVNKPLNAQSGISVNGTSSTITSTTGSIGFGSNNLSTTGTFNAYNAGFGIFGTGNSGLVLFNSSGVLQPLNFPNDSTKLLKGNGTWGSATGLSSQGWSLTGNAGTNASNNFIGTTDSSQVLLFKVKNHNSGFINYGGSTFFGYASGYSMNPYAINFGNSGFGQGTLQNVTESTGGYFNTAVGAGALTNLTSGYNNTAVGYNSMYDNNGTQNTAIGVGSDCGSVNCVSVGWNATSTGTYNSNLGANTRTTGSYNTLLGYDANTSFSNDIAIGFEPQATNDNQAIFGGQGQISNGVYFNGVIDDSHTDIALHACGAGSYYSNETGSNFTVAGGIGTGTGHGGYIAFQVAPAGTSSGTTPNALTEAMRIASAGNIGLGTTAPDASALLDAESTTRGLLIPRMTSTQRLAIASPANGLQVYDNTLNALFYYDGTNWDQLTASSSATALTSGFMPIATAGGGLTNSPIAVNNGNIGVGTSAPTDALHLVLSSAYKGVTMEGDYGKLTWKNSAGLVTESILGSAYNSMQFYGGENQDNYYFYNYANNEGMFNILGGSNIVELSNGDAPDASSSSTLTNSATFNFKSQYWNGSSNVYSHTGIQDVALDVSGNHYLSMGGTLNVYDNSSVGVGSTTKPDGSALVDMGSTTQGVLIPRMTTEQRLAITSPANGLQVYDNSIKAIFYYDGSSWNQLTASAAANSLRNGHIPVAAASGSLANSPLAVSNDNIGIGTESPDAALNISSSSTTNQLAVSTTNEDGVQDVFVVDNAGNTTISGSTTVAGSTTLYGNTGVGAVETSITPLSAQSNASHFASFIATTPSGTSSSTPYCIMANVDYTLDPNMKALAVHNTTFDGNPNTPYDAFFVQANGNIYTNGTLTTHDPLSGNSLFTVDGSGNTMMAGQLNVVGSQVTMSGIVADTIADTIPGNILQMDRAGHLQPLTLGTIQKIFFPPGPVGIDPCVLGHTPNHWTPNTNNTVLYTYHCQQVGIGTSIPNAALTIANGDQTKQFSIINPSSGLDVFSIDQFGNTVINGVDGTYTINPSSAVKLAVDGQIVAKDVLVSERSGWPDYVFKRDYKLLSLEEVEKYIKKNQHLPELASADSLQEQQGVSVSEMMKTQTKKIEELTLYLIQLNKEVKALEEENEKLKQAGDNK